MRSFIHYDWERVCFISGKLCKGQYWLNHSAACMSDIYIVKNSHHHRTVCHPFQRTNGCLTPPTHLPIVPWSGYSTMIAFNQQYIHQRESALAWSSPQGIPQASSSWEGSLINLAGMHQPSEKGAGGGVLRRGVCLWTQHYIVLLPLHSILHLSTTISSLSKVWHFIFSHSKPSTHTCSHNSWTIKQGMCVNQKNACAWAWQL